VAHSQKMKFPITFLVLIILISCNRTLELKINPFEPNFNATLDNLRQWGFENKFFLDDGVCIYTKNIEQRIDMYFYLNVGDDCYKTTGQGIIIRLDTLGYHATFDELVPNNQDEWFLQNQQEFKKDSLEIINLLKTYNGTKVSNTERHGGSENLKFNVKATDSKEIYECIYSAYPQNQKALNFEITWTN